MKSDGDPIHGSRMVGKRSYTIRIWVRLQHVIENEGKFIHGGILKQQAC